VGSSSAISSSIFFDAPARACFPFCPTFYQAMLVRMQTAQTATFLQSLIILFAFLIHSHRDAVLDLLESTHIGEDGRSGLDVLLNVPGLLTDADQCTRAMHVVTRGTALATSRRSPG
jgi:hypothetical protein